MNEDFQNPRVFISHSVKDQDRFVDEFATLLRNKGADAWHFKWEISGGESIPSKIFLDGLNEANVFILIVSKNIKNRPAIELECEAAFYKKTNGQLRIIPIVIDETSLPQLFENLYSYFISDLDNYDAELEKIIADIFQKSIKPKIGEPPNFTQKNSIFGGNLNAIDDSLLQEICRLSLENNKDDFYPNDFDEIFSSLEISKENGCDSLRFLIQANFLTSHGVTGSYVPTVTLNESSFHKYVYHTTQPSFGHAMWCKIGALCLNESINTESQLIERLGLPTKLVMHIVKQLEKQRQISIPNRVGSGGSDSFQVLPALSRSVSKYCN